MHCAATILLGLLACGPGAETIDVKLDMKTEDVKFLLPSPMPSQIELSDKAPATAKTASAKPGTLWGALPFGPTTQPGELLVAVDDSTLHVDVNGNGDPMDDPPGEWKLTDADRPEASRFEGNVKLPIKNGSSSDNVRVFAYRFSPAAAKARGLSEKILFYYRDYCTSGQMKIGDKPVQIVLTDETTIGDFTFPGGR